ncbi:MAG TPA: metal-dependent hydrolase, partial [Arthrobacter sp.]|nr:metal-dependent hydrolase [Arthrobacter sp.]
LTGVVVHIVGDMITTGGVPLLWPIVVKPPKFLRKLPLVKDVWKANGAFSIPLLGRAGSRREWLVLIPVGAYAMVGMWAAAVALARGHVPAAVAFGTALVRRVLGG